jgi:probable addiction module antidote protein
MKSKPYLPMLLERLKDSQFAVDYLSEVLQHESQEAFLIALRHVIDARQESISEIADQSGLTRQGLYKTLSEEGNPRLSTLNQILKSLGMSIKITGDAAA